MSGTDSPDPGSESPDSRDSTDSSRAAAGSDAAAGSGAAAGSARRSTVGVVLLIAVLSAGLIFYFLLLGRRGIELIQVGTPASIGLGAGVLLLPILGAWILWSTIAAGLAHQRLARLIDEQDLELDVSDLPRRPSGRFERDAADELFARVRTEVEADPDDWRGYYRLARAYDYAGDRSRTRATMRRAVELERRQRAS